MKRTKDYDEELSERLRTDKKFAQKLIRGITEDEDLSIHHAVLYVVNVMGPKQFAEFAGMTREYVKRVIMHKKNIPKPETLDKFLEPFGLKTRLVLEKSA